VRFLEKSHRNRLEVLFEQINEMTTMLQKRLSHRSKEVCELENLEKYNFVGIEDPFRLTSDRKRVHSHGKLTISLSVFF
jgi:hypothetical protein